MYMRVISMLVTLKETIISRDETVPKKFLNTYL